MKKMRRGVALLLSVLLVWTPAGTVRADETPGTADANEQIEIQENKVSEDEAQANEAQAIQMQAAVGESAQVSTLTFGRETVVQDSKVVTPSGEGWNYDSSTNTLHVIEDVTIQTNNQKAIESTGDLHITVETGVTLTVNSTCTSNTRYVIYADGDILLDGEGTINITHDVDGRGIKAGKGITIQGITLNISTEGSLQEICANGDALVIKDAVVTVKGTCAAWDTKNNNYYPVRILGHSVVDIVSTIANGGLRGETFEFSDQAHVKVQSSRKLICGANSVFKLAAGQTEDYYFRSTTDGNSFTKGNIDVNRASYFEYIGANHVDKATIKQNDDEKTHTMQCGCEGERKTSITAGCSGGTATCTEKAVCEVCGQSYGDKDPHQYNEYHVCSVCGEPYTSDDPYDSNRVIVAVVANGEKRGYTEDEIEAAIDFAGTHPGAVLTIIAPARGCLDKLKVNNPDADFTIELDGKNNGNYGSVTVSSGKVTIRDSKTGGTFFHIRTQGTGIVTLESGTIKSGGRGNKWHVQCKWRNDFAH